MTSEIDTPPSPAEGSDAQFSYVGEELDYFAHALNWKRYWFEQIQPFLGTDVLEVGAGHGNNTLTLLNAPDIRLTALEPDAGLVAQHRDRLQAAGGNAASRVTLETGTLTSLPADRLFDSILYIDVLEHIEHDRAEALEALKHLRPGGNLIVLSPAFQCLYSPFDKALGHFRRYTLGSLEKAIPASLRQRKLTYLDSAAFFLSLGNKLLLQQSLPTLAQIQLWDRKVLPVSRVTDRFLSGCIGRSVLGIWQKS